MNIPGFNRTRWKASASTSTLWNYTKFRILLQYYCNLIQKTGKNSSCKIYSTSSLCKRSFCGLPTHLKQKWLWSLLIEVRWVYTNQSTCWFLLSFSSFECYRLLAISISSNCVYQTFFVPCVPFYIRISITRPTISSSFKYFWFLNRKNSFKLRNFSLQLNASTKT